MKHKQAGRRSSSEQTIRDIKRKTRKQYGAEEKIRIVMDGLRGEDGIAEQCRREGIAQSLYYREACPWGTSGRRTLWRLARSAWLAILSVRPIRSESLTYGALQKLRNQDWRYDSRHGPLPDVRQIHELSA